MALTVHACCLPESRNQPIADLRCIRRVACEPFRQKFIFPLCPPQNQARVADGRNECHQRTKRQGASPGNTLCCDSVLQNPCKSFPATPFPPPGDTTVVWATMSRAYASVNNGLRT